MQEKCMRKDVYNRCTSLQKKKQYLYNKNHYKEFKTYFTTFDWDSEVVDIDLFVDLVIPKKTKLIPQSHADNICKCNYSIYLQLFCYFKCIFP